MRKFLQTLLVVAFFGYESSAFAATASCEDEFGAKQTPVLVKRCISISPATHPPPRAT